MILAMSVLTLGLMDLYSFALMGFTISVIPMIEMILGIFLSSAALVGLVMIVSSLIRSDLLVLGISILMIIVFSFMWSSITQSAITALGIGYALSHRPELMSAWLLSYYINPLGSLTLSSSLVTGYLMNIVFSTSFSPYNPTLGRVLVDGVIWTVFTFAVTLVLSRKTT